MSKLLKKTAITGLALGFMTTPITALAAPQGAELKPITAERQAQQQEIAEMRFGKTLDFLNDYVVLPFAAFNDFYFENAEDRPMTQERLEQQLFITQNRLATWGRFSYQGIEEFLTVGRIGTVRYDNTIIRAAAGTQATALGQVHAGFQVRHLGGFTNAPGQFWEHVEIIRGTQNVGVRGWIRGDLLNW